MLCSQRNEEREGKRKLRGLLIPCRIPPFLPVSDRQGFSVSLAVMELAL